MFSVITTDVLPNTQKITQPIVTSPTINELQKQIETLKNEFESTKKALDNQKELYTRLEVTYNTKVSEYENIKKKDQENEKLIKKYTEEIIILKYIPKPKNKT
jgi:predicted  nucleic acid-binding Zn-ribbon protein